MTRDLILIPTESEAKHIEPALRERLALKNGLVDNQLKFARCGFGLVAAAARSSQLLAEDNYRCVWLLGIAGSFGPDLAIGRAFEFSSVASYGIGAGEADDFVSSDEMGWPQWSSQQITIGTSIPLRGNTSWKLLSSTSASGSMLERSRKIARFPDANAEDMEGFGVAVSCELARTPLRILRGISNMVGDRDRKNWSISAALSAVVDLAAYCMHADNKSP